MSGSRETTEVSSVWGEGRLSSPFKRSLQYSVLRGTKEQHHCPEEQLPPRDLT